jgi:hypothetical protein
MLKKQMVFFVKVGPELKITQEPSLCVHTLSHFYTTEELSGAKGAYGTDHRHQQIPSPDTLQERTRAPSHLTVQYDVGPLAP